MRPSRSARPIAVTIALVAVAACGGDDDSADVNDGADTAAATTDDTATSAAPTAPPTGVDTTPAPTATGSDDDAAAGGGAPGDLPEPTGTVTVGGETWEVAGLARTLEDGETVELGGDFLICEADNPAFPGDANIIAVLDDDLQFSFLVSGGETTVEYGGLFDAEETTSVDFERQGDTITGTAELPAAGAAEFVLDCG